MISHPLMRPDNSAHDSHCSSFAMSCLLNRFVNELSMKALAKAWEEQSPAGLVGVDAGPVNLEIGRFAEDCYEKAAPL